MNPLLEKLEEYRTIVNYRYVYEFDNGDSLEYKMRQTEFPHLLGLHKLTDIPIIQQFNNSDMPNISARYILSRIKKEELLTDSIVRSSSKFGSIEERYNNFTKENLLTLSYTDVIIDFNAALIGSSLNSKYVLFEKKKGGGYNHLCIGNGSKGSYIETFFYQPTDRYIAGQKVSTVTKVTIFDNTGNIFLADDFSR